MNVRIYEEVARKIGQANLLSIYKSDNVKFERFSWTNHLEIDLHRLSRKQLVQLLEWVAPLAKPRTQYKGAQILHKDLVTWRQILDGKGTGSARSVEHFKSLMLQFLSKHAPGQRLYGQDTKSGVWYASYVNRVTYHPKYRSNDYEHPAHTDLELVWLQHGGRRGSTVKFYAEDCLHMAVQYALARKNYAVETPELRATYLQEIERYQEVARCVGAQFLATGRGETYGIDGNSDNWRHPAVVLERDGPSRVVLDLFSESKNEDEDDDDNRVHVDPWFWHSYITSGKDTDEDDEDDDRDAKLADLHPDKAIIDIPLHPLVVVFSMKAHERCEVHVSQLTDYVYDPTLGDKLVLPPDQRRLVEMLLKHKGGFKDIVQGKSGGAIVLCAGRPGLGKTLTAEVYAEVMERPLYSVQCSQLGVNPEELEKALLLAFTRAERWEAILLLDEADVYVAQRGNDLNQNAIVGVFLRVLEYYKGVLFLTTNRDDLVDDAVASRCVAKLTYTYPPPADQARLWEILSATSGMKMPKAVISSVVKKHPHLSGRDIKNLLKLAQMMEPTGNVKAETIDFVKRFKPTGGDEGTT